MKKITLLLFLGSAFVFAQQPQSYTEVSTSYQTATVNGSSEKATIVRVDNNRLPIIDTYTTLVDFNSAVNANCSSTTLTSEDFSGGPGSITDCGLIISSNGDGCFPAGELEAGFDAQASDFTTMINIPTGAIGNVDSLIGATTFVNYTIINFSPEVYAIAMDIWENNDPNTEVRIYGAGGSLIDTFSVTTPTNSQTFFGFISDEPVSKVELEGANGSGELFGNFLFGGDCAPLSVNNSLLAQVSIYPNPVTNVLNLKMPSNVIVENAVLYDVLGKNTGTILINGEMNTSNLSVGVYLLKVVTSAGTLTQKIIKQ